LLYNTARTHLSVNKDAPKPRTGSHFVYAISRRTSSSVRASLISDRHQCDELAPLHYQPQAREMASQLFKQVR
jgi:hypothetical protein